MKFERMPDIDHQVALGALGFQVENAIDPEQLVEESGAHAVVVEGALDEGGIVWVVGLDEEAAGKALKAHKPAKKSPVDDELAALKAKAEADEKLTPTEIQQALRGLLRKV